MIEGAKIEIINDKDLMALFNELTPKVKNKIINTGLKNAARLIINEAKRNFKSIKKNKSKTGYSGFLNAFQVREMKKREGVVTGLSSRTGYKYRFLNYGTEQRHYKTKAGNEHNTGKIEPTNWWSNAVETKKATAQQDVQTAITKAMTKTVEKWNKKYKI